MHVLLIAVGRWHWHRHHAIGVPNLLICPQAKVLPATPATGLPTSGGAAERLISDSANGLASTVLASTPAGDQLTNVGLFIDQNSQMVGRTASTKYGGGYGYGGGGGYYRGGGGYNRGGGGNYRGGGGYYRGGEGYYRG